MRILRKELFIMSIDHRTSLRLLFLISLRVLLIPTNNICAVTIEETFRNLRIEYEINEKFSPYLLEDLILVSSLTLTSKPLPETAKTPRSAKEELQQIKREFEELEQLKQTLSDNFEKYRQLIEQEKLQELEHSKTQIKEEKNSVRYLGMLSDVMSDFRTFLISRIRPTLSSYSSDFFSRLTDGKYPEVELDENYDLLVYDNGEKFGIERFSGGEEDLANLCLRLAISEVITERAGGVFNFIVLDEIFGSQDMNRRKNIMIALNGLSSKFRQIFLITHVDELKNDMENVIVVNENMDGFSSVKIE